MDSSPHWVIIPAFNGFDLLPDCIRSVKDSDGDWEVLIVDNASTDGTSELYITGLGAMYCRNTKNLGFGAACNKGIKEALSKGAQTVSVLNQDTTVDRKCLTRMLAVLGRYEETGIVSPMIYNSDGFLFKNFSGWLTSSNPNFLVDAINGNLKDDYKVHFLNAACWMFKKDALERAGGFDPIFFMYQEDKELARRFSYYGYDLRLSTFSTLNHLSVLMKKNDDYLRSIEWASVKPLSNMLGSMREYSRSYLRNLPSSLRGWFKGMMASLLSLDHVASLGYLLALIKFFMYFRQNARAYNSVIMKKSSLFIEIDE